jgi:peptidoglycan-associated lipoprotein
MKIFKLFSFVIVALLAFSSLAQAQRNYMEIADNSYKKGDFYIAIDQYKEAYSKEKDKAKKAEIIYKTAGCYRMANDTKQSEVWYDKAIKANYPDALAVLYYAQALKANGKYDEAIVQFNKYKQLNSSDPRGEVGAKSCEMAQKWKDKPTRYKVENVAFLNTPNADFATAYANREYKALYFTSGREEAMGSKVDGWTGEKFTDLFETSMDKKGKWSLPKPLGAPISTESNEGSATLDAKGNTMYFTRCQEIKNKGGVCKVYMAKKKGKDWDEPLLLPFNSDSFTVGHPSLSADESTLFFASDMPGGQGGKDIWMSSFDKKTKTWGSPVNLGPSVNTAGDELYPFIHKDGTLYFSSDTHPGMGALDIFSASLKGKEYTNITNLKYPINSAADDFGIIFEGEAERGYFSSEREGGKGKSDIYSFYLPPLEFTLKGKIIDVDKKTDLAGVLVELIPCDGSAAALKITTDASGSYLFDKKQVKANTCYKLQVSKKGYFGDKVEVSTIGKEESEDMIKDFALKITKTPIVLPNIEYDLGKWDLRPVSKVELEKLLKILNDNPNLVIEIGSHTDTRATDAFNDTLSNKRALSVVEFLSEKGIVADRLAYKGYGERVPRKITDDKQIFPSGSVITDAFIAKLKTNDEKEAAHQLNRRTEFKVLRDDYVPKTVVAAPAPAADGSTAPASAPGVAKTHLVKKGETLFSISKKYGISVQELKKMNNMAEDAKIEVGSKMVVGQ